MITVLAVLGLFFSSTNSAAVNSKTVPPYIKQCYEGDPDMIKCFIGSVHHLRPYLSKGIPEIELPSVEPFKMEELALSLTSGPNGYRIALKNVDVFGASNFTMRKLRLSDEKRPFETVIYIPLLKIYSRYESSGVLIILPASGNGTFNGQLEGLEAKVKGRASVSVKDNEKYLHVDSLNVDLTLKNVHLQVKNIYNNNLILTQAINLFLRENGMEVFNIMLPQLRKQLSGLFMSISNALLSHVPLHTFYVPKET